MPQGVTGCFPWERVNTVIDGITVETFKRGDAVRYAYRGSLGIRGWVRYVCGAEIHVRWRGYLTNQVMKAWELRKI